VNAEDPLSSEVLLGRHRIANNDGHPGPRMTAKRPLVVVVEDEPDLAGIVEYNLRNAGFDVITTPSGKDGLALAQTRQPALVLLDVMLPDASGMDVCRQLKREAATRFIPVVLVTARGEEVDRVVGFELGCDDYVTKPFSVRELVLRVRAVLRRAQPSEPGHMLRVGPLTLDNQAHRVTVANQEVTLTALEFRLLETLLTRRNRVQTREVLLTDVWGLDVNVETRTVDTHVKRLREKLGPAGTYIETVRGVGYRLSTSPSEDG
jgi:two-component system, OmpR family, phosphate regulon response regulator PhoB